MRGWLKILGAIAAVIAVLLAAWLVLRLTIGPGEDADVLVQQALEALKEVPVKGTVVTTVRTPDGRREVRAKMHRGDGRFMMRILSGAREGAIVVRQEGTVWMRGREGKLTRRTDIGQTGIEPKVLRNNWSFETAGTRRVARRWATFIRGYGPGGSVKLAVDRETSFPLYIARSDSHGDLISETTWREVDFSVEPPRKLKPPARREGHRHRRMSLEDVREAVAFTVHEPGWLPDGWELQAWFLHDRPVAKVVEARFSDGLRPMVILQREEPDRSGRQLADEQRRKQWKRWRDHRREMRNRRDDQRPMPRERHGRGPLQHLRGAGADASRREIDGTVVIVIAPVSADQREKVLDEMKPPG